MGKKRLTTGAAVGAVGAESKDTDDFTAVCDYSHEWRAVDQAVHVYKSLFKSLQGGEIGTPE